MIGMARDGWSVAGVILGGLEWCWYRLSCAEVECRDEWLYKGSCIHLYTISKRSIK